MSLLLLFLLFLLLVTLWWDTRASPLPLMTRVVVVVSMLLVRCLRSRWYRCYRCCYRRLKSRRCCCNRSLGAMCLNQRVWPLEDSLSAALATFGGSCLPHRALHGLESSEVKTLQAMAHRKARSMLRSLSYPALPPKDRADRERSMAPGGDAELWDIHSYLFDSWNTSGLLRTSDLVCAELASCRSQPRPAQSLGRRGHSVKPQSSLVGLRIFGSTDIEVGSGLATCLVRI